MISVVVTSKKVAEQLEPFQSSFSQRIYVNPNYVNEKLNSCITDKMGELDASKISGDWLVEIPTGCKINLGMVQRITNTIRDAEFEEKITHVAIPTRIEMPSFNPLHGFAFVCLAIEWIWNLFENGKLYNYTDVRIIAMVTKGGSGRFLAPRRRTWRVWNENCVKKGAPSESNLVGWTPYIFRRHLHMKLWGFWVLPYITAYIMLAIPLFWGSFSAYTATIWALQSTYAYLVGKKYAKSNYTLLFALLFPIYWALFPIYLIYERN
jgi:hypothetical protein